MLPGTLSLIIFSIEFIILLGVIIFNRDHPFFWSIVAMIALLQLYQLSEFLICIGIGVNITGRIGYVIITFLPATGYYIASKIVKWKYPDYLVIFALATGFSLYYLIVPTSISLVNCNPLYAIYHSEISILYTTYYMSSILYSILFLLAHLIWRKDKIDSKTSLMFIIGYLSFLVPMILMIWIDSFFKVTVTSIMCKYALSLAVILGAFSFVKPKNKEEVEEVVEEKLD